MYRPDPPHIPSGKMPDSLFPSYHIAPKLPYGITDDQEEATETFLNWKYVECGRFFLERALMIQGGRYRSMEFETQLERDAMVYFLKSLPKDGAVGDSKTYELRRLMREWLQLAPCEMGNAQAAAGTVVSLRQLLAKDAPGSAWPYRLGYWFGNSLLIILNMILLLAVNFIQGVVWIPEKSAILWLSSFGSLYRCVSEPLFALCDVNDGGLGQRLAQGARSLIQDIANGFRDGVKQQPQRTQPKTQQPQTPASETNDTYFTPTA